MHASSLSRRALHVDGDIGVVVVVVVVQMPSNVNDNPMQNQPKRQSVVTYLTCRGTSMMRARSIAQTTMATQDTQDASCTTASTKEVGTTCQTEPGNTKQETRQPTTNNQQEKRQTTNNPKHIHHNSYHPSGRGVAPL
jgi:hypothetical protein